MRILSLTPVVEHCRLCKKEFSNNVGEMFNPLGYIPGLCSNCNHDVLKGLLSKGHCIFKGNYVREIENKY